ncbi:MAG: hypothetical protein E1N59_410 [Puniceicoccaceae bacterium 5H]|nr:MAG: hypothetical protein E1N59_410 [Puniceicoccaceae bacterium 5H]
MVTKQEANWKTNFEKGEGVTPLHTDAGFEILKDFCVRLFKEGSDSIHYSPAYYYFTTRRGGWIYRKDNSLCVVGLHPNRPDHLLIYPEIAETETDLVHDLLFHMPSFDGEVQIARVSARSTRFGTTTEERYLDWRYPVRVLSTEKATEQNGPDLHHVRKEYRKLDQQAFEFRPFTGKETHRLNQVGHIYARVFLGGCKGEFGLDYNQIVVPNLQMLQYCLERPDIFNSVVSFYKGQPEGFFVWEKLTDTTANALWFLYNREIRGLSYMQLASACEMLKQQGIKTCNFGGSETKGMDFFKTRFRPLHSHQLKSVVIPARASLKAVA